VDKRQTVDDNFNVLLLIAIWSVTGERRASAECDVQCAGRCVQLLNRPRSVYMTRDGGIDSLLRGLSSQTIQQYDRFVTDQVTVHLFADDPPLGVGTDLVALNIQRGRDHGIPGVASRILSDSRDCFLLLAAYFHIDLGSYWMSHALKLYGDCIFAFCLKS